MSAIMTHAASDVLAERQRQQDAEGWTLDHDDGHELFELSSAACCYAWAASRPSGWRAQAKLNPELAQSAVFFHDNWPWDLAWWKPKTRRGDLVRAGALILAEIERLDRRQGRPDDQSHEEKTAADSAEVDPSSRDFKAGMLFALTEAQRESDQAHIYRIVAENADLSWSDARELLEPYDLIEAAVIFDEEYSSPEEEVLA